MIQSKYKIRNIELALSFNPSWAYGAAGRADQLKMLGKILGTDLPPAAQEDLLLMGLGLARWSWQHYPLDGDVLRLLSTLIGAGANFGAMGVLAGAVARALRSFTAAGGEIPVSFANPDILTEFLNALPTEMNRVVQKIANMAMTIISVTNTFLF